VRNDTRLEAAASVTFSVDSRLHEPGNLRNKYATMFTRGRFSVQGRHDKRNRSARAVHPRRHRETQRSCEHLDGDAAEAADSQVTPLAVYLHAANS
jgi:hypothetical protein